MNTKKEKNINTVDYWNTRFGTGDWAKQGGFTQTQLFAQAQIPLLNIPADFTGQICDFGCGAGDSFPIYSKAWPKAKLLGIDFSVAAIEICTERFGKIAEFKCGDISTTPKVDIIICSNVLEHLDNDIDIVRQLLTKCKKLYVIIPYEEYPLSSEHTRSYNHKSFFEFTVIRKVIFKTKGWTEYGISNIANIYLKNIYRNLTKQPIHPRRQQILFEFTGTLPSDY